MLTPFGGNPVRIIVREDGSVLFHLRESCTALGMKSSKNANLDDDEFQLFWIADPLGRKRKTAFVTEAGLKGSTLIRTGVIVCLPQEMLPELPMRDVFAYHDMPRLGPQPAE